MRVEGEILYMPNLGVRRVRLSCEFPLTVLNDANAFAYAEYRVEHPNCRVLFGVTLGTGIGSGLVVDGKIYTGAGLASEFGHVHVGLEGRRCTCGGVDHLEAYFSGWAFKRDFGMPAEELARRMPGRIRERLKYLARGLANVVHLLDPEVIVFGGGLSAAVSLEDLKAELSPLLMPGFKPRLEMSSLRHAAACGAALLAEDSFG